VKVLPLIVALTLAAVPLMAESAGEIYQRALAKEKGEGDFKEAIKLYGKVTKEAEEDSPLAARARLRLGLCEEKLGLERAREAYDDIGADEDTPAEVRLEAGRRLLSNQRRQLELAGEAGVAIDPRTVQRALIAQLRQALPPGSPLVEPENWQQLQDELERIQKTLPQHAAPEMEVHLEALRQAAEEQEDLQKQLREQQLMVQQEVMQQQQRLREQMVEYQMKVQDGVFEQVHVSPQAFGFQQQLDYLKKGWVSDFQVSIEQAKIDGLLAKAALGTGSAEAEKKEYQLAKRKYDLGKISEEKYREVVAAYERALVAQLPVEPVEEAFTAQRQFIEQLIHHLGRDDMEKILVRLERQMEGVERLSQKVAEVKSSRLQDMIENQRRLLSDLEGIVREAASRPSFTVPYPHTVLGKLPGLWKFSRSYPSMAAEAVDPDLDDSTWMDIDIYHTPGTRYAGAGTAWFRTTVDSLNGDAQKPVHLAFAGINAEVYVFVNGRYVGEHHHWGRPFVLDITPAVDYEGENKLAVCMVSEGGNSNLRGEMYLLQPAMASADFLLANRGGGLEGQAPHGQLPRADWSKRIGLTRESLGLGQMQRYKNYAAAPTSTPFAVRSVGTVPRRWRFWADQEQTTPEMHAEYIAPDFNHDSWTEINVAQAWEDQGYQGYNQGAWYRTQVAVKAKKGEPVYLAFGGVDRDAWVYVNGRLVGNHHIWNRPFYLDISKVVNYDGDNTIAVRVWDGTGMGGIYGKVEVVQAEKGGPLSDN
jgi:hypothetical protein